jgi:hypothetical protein
VQQLLLLQGDTRQHWVSTHAVQHCPAISSWWACKYHIGIVELALHCFPALYAEHQVQRTCCRTLLLLLLCSAPSCLRHACSLCTRIGASNRQLPKQSEVCRAYHGELEQQAPPGSTVKYNAHYDAAAINRIASL